MQRSLIPLAALSLGATAPAQPAVQKQTFTYKKVADLEIKADVYRAADKAVRPVVVWIHGGALINGHRRAVHRRFQRAFLAAGYIVLSCDYRLAPETKLPEIIEDIEDLFRWIRAKGPALFQADPERIAVCGGSAGGYLTLVTGHRVEPRPAALVSLWGYGDLIGDWYSKPSTSARHHRVKLTREEAFAQVSGPPIANGLARKGNGGAFYQYCRQQGLWPEAVSGWNPHTEAAKFKPYMPVENVSASYPPTLLIHGSDDTDVPQEQSVMMAAALRKHGVPHELMIIPGGEHGLAGAPRARIASTYEWAIRFVRRRLDAPRVGGVGVDLVLRRLGAELEEGMTAQELRSYERQFDLTDTDGDGKHSAAEYVDRGRYMNERARRMIFRAADANGDGAVTKAEYVVNRVITDEAKAIMAAFDDGGGVARRTFLEDCSIRDGALARAVFAALDGDGDGRLTTGEYLRVWGRWARAGRESAAERLRVARVRLAR